MLKLRPRLEAAARDGTVFAILDPARLDEQAAGEWLASQPWHCLYPGGIDSQTAAVMPHLCFPDPLDPQWPARLDLGWRLGALMFGWIGAADDADALLEHFRELLFVEHANGQTDLFRFYDGRVLAALAQLGAPPAWGRILGPARALCAMTGVSEEALVLSHDGQLQRWHLV